ncbi:MAG: hypothetical protein A2X49_02770 [Lentisphaerae bacterium GWF2_52_8]|nr:MAG: hypothetical protein A2X49_02770 [Lentisphaerae bacterium GWF2_52_8]
MNMKKTSIWENISLSERKSCKAQGPAKNRAFFYLLKHSALPDFFSVPIPYFTCLDPIHLTDHYIGNACANIPKGRS